jgi:hypothetical protein
MHRNHKKFLQDLYHLEFYIADSLNERRERKKLFTEGIFSPSSTAELGDKAGFVAARFVRSDFILIYLQPNNTSVFIKDSFVPYLNNTIATNIPVLYSLFICCGSGSIRIESSIRIQEKQIAKILLKS